MTLHDGWMLLGGVVALYLYDSALLLFHNEIVLVGKRRGYGVSAGSSLVLAGRHVFLPSPLCPHQPLFRMSWSERGQPVEGGKPLRIARVRIALSAMSYWMWLLLTLFVVGLPYVLLVSHDPKLLLAWIASVYTVIVAILMQVYRYRKALNLTRRAVAAVALDALLCAPFALNIVRKIGLRQSLNIDLRVAATSLLPEAAVKQLAAVLRQRIEISLGFIEPGDAQFLALSAYLNDFEALCR
ncbi:hypothetical protein [Dyella sp. 2HG41-7]|uniref:hypothetical protein n=1 Tax=Dyella sp. 2HG41-7 TaxID=2883239 RepID=UPI001F1BC818|nr:hypothetical protein [Dyella sp. 2HG41-7]